MGSVLLTAVNAFADTRAAQYASARLANRGYPVIAAGRLDEIAVRNDLFAIVGAAHDHERMIAISRRLHDRVAALAVVGGPLAILLGQHEGLTMPTLLVSDRVGRSDRRRAARRLPRGSMLVRAADFDAALDAVVAFLDRAGERVHQPISRGTLRPLALRLTPAAFLAPAAALMLAGSGASAAAVCTHEQGSGLLTITCDGEGGATLALTTSADGLILLDINPVAKLSEVQKISILTTGGDDVLTIDEAQNKFRSGPDDEPIVFEVDMGGGIDELKWIGSSGDDSFKLSAEAFDVPGGVEFEQKILGVDLLNFALGDGDDAFDGGSWPLKIEVDGGQGKDSLIGGLGPDVFKLSSGGDLLDGKEGVDLVKIATDETLLKITDATIELAESDNIVGYKGMEALEFRGGDKTASKIEIAGFNFAKLDLDGAGGGDSLKLTTGLPAVQLTADKISLSDELKLVGEIKYAGFDTFSYVGDTAASKVEIDGLKFAKLDLDGGGGGDIIKLRTADSLIGITDEAISLNFSKIEIDYKAFSELNLIGDTTASKIEIDGLKFAKLDLDGGGGGDIIKLRTAESLIGITDEAISLNFSKIEIDYKAFTELNLIGDTTASKVEIDGLKFAKLDLDGGGGGDIIKLKTADSLIGITDEAISLNFSKIEIDYKAFSELNLIGDTTASKIEIAGFNFAKLDLNGGGGGDSLKLTTGLPAVQLTADKISLSDQLKLLGEIKYAGFDTFSYLGDETASKIDIDGLTFSKLELDGGGGGDTIKLKTDATFIGITDSAISLNFSKIEIDYKEYSELNLIGDTTASKIEIKEFTGLAKLDLDGGGGLDEIKFSTGESLLKITDLSLAPGTLNPIAHKGFESLSVLAVTDVANTFDGSKVTTLKLTLDGGSKDDVLLGGSLNDLLTGGTGNNKISGGGGMDTLVEAVNGDFVASSSTLTGAGLDAFSSIEALKLTGGVGDNRFNTEPFKGQVTLDGGAGNDLLIAGANADVLIGGLGNDSLVANQGNDTLLAGGGDDTLNGGPGTDFGDGGPGVDTGKSIENSLNIER